MGRGMIYSDKLLFNTRWYCLIHALFFSGSFFAFNAGNLNTLLTPPLTFFHFKNSTFGVQVNTPTHGCTL